MATDYANVVPTAVASEVLASAEQQSAVMALSRTIRMPAGVTNIPVVSVAPTAAFVTPVYGGRKPITTVEWSAQKIVAEELACTLAIPNAFLDDAGFPVWESVRNELAKAVAFAIDDAALNGTGAPASFPAGGLIAAAGAAVGGTTDLEALDGAMRAVEAMGFPVDGIAGGTRLFGIMRGLGQGLVVPTAAPPTTIWGLSWKSSPAWDYTKGDELVGDWSYSVVGIRQDIRFELSTEGVLTDGAGKVTINAFQDDSTLMRCYMRLGYVIGKALPARKSGSALVAPFALAQGPAPTGGAAAASASRSSTK